MKTSTFTDTLAHSADLQELNVDQLEAAKGLFLPVVGRYDGTSELHEAIQDLCPEIYLSQLRHSHAAAAYATMLFTTRLLSAASRPSWMRWSTSVPGALLTLTGFELREAVRTVWKRFERRAAQADQIEYGLGFGGSDAAWECTRHFDTRLSCGSSIGEIARKAGRMFTALHSAKATRIIRVPEEIYDVELGADLSRLLPSELGHLGQASEILLLDRLGRRQALQYAVRGSESTSRGPLVLLIDESGSMHDSRGAWAKAITIAMTRVAWEDGRKVVAVPWSTATTSIDLAPGDDQALLRTIEHWYGGDNAAWLALCTGAAQVERLQRSGDRGADVILLTDGVEPIGTRHLDALDALDRSGARLWTVAIECEIGADNPLRFRAAEYAFIDQRGIARNDLPVKGSVL